MALQECTLNLDRSLRELRPQGTLEFPCAAYSSAYGDRAQAEIPWHCHGELEVILIAEGAMRVAIPGRSFLLRGGEGVFINSGVLHRAAAEPDCELRSLVFSASLIGGDEGSVFARRYVGPLVGGSAPEGVLLLPDGGWRQEALGAFSSAFAAMLAERPGYEFAVREGLSRLCLLLYRQCVPQGGGPEPRTDPDRERLRSLLDFIHAHYAEKLELPRIAQAANIGERECLRCFRRCIQISPVQYLIRYRLMQSAALLTGEGGCGIAEISTRCGFDSPSNFSKTFRRYFGCTPKEYRNSGRA